MIESLDHRADFKPEKTAPKPKKPLKRKSNLTRATQSLGGQASIRKRRASSGIPADAPKNASGDSCVEKTCPTCESVFLVRWAERYRRKTCSVKCATILKRSHGRDRKGPKNPNFKGGTRTGVRDREGERRWRVAFGRECYHPGCRGGEIIFAQHHVVYAQKVRRVGGDVWDPRNSLTLCQGCHSSHHRRGTRIVPLSALTDANYAFAEELLGGAAYDYLRLRYVGSDRRLDAIRTRYYATDDADRR